TNYQAVHKPVSAIAASVGHAYEIGAIRWRGEMHFGIRAQLALRLIIVLVVHRKRRQAIRDRFKPGGVRFYDVARLVHGVRCSARVEVTATFSVRHVKKKTGIRSLRRAEERSEER